jgi:uncharacterized protein (DUF58 family)
MEMSATKSILSHLKLRAQAEASAAELPALMARAEKAATSILSGEHRQRKSGTGEQFWQYREYVPGDPISDIDWRASGKSDRLFIRQKEWQTTQTALFWIQNDKSMEYASSSTLPTKKWDAASLSLSIAILMIKAGEHIAPLTRNVRAGKTNLALEKLAETALLETAAPLKDAPISTIKDNVNLILAGDFLMPLDELESAFAMLSQKTASALIVQTLDPAELNLPFEGRFIFEDHNQQKEHIQNAGAIKDQYQDRINAHIEGVKALCKKHRFNWLLHKTGTKLEKTLFDAWLMLSHEYSVKNDKEVIA